MTRKYIWNEQEKERQKQAYRLGKKEATKCLRKAFKEFEPVRKPKQQYIYVARDSDAEGLYNFDIKKMRKCEAISGFCFDGMSSSEKPFLNIKLKKGEQKRIPILVDKAEVVENEL